MKTHPRPESFPKHLSWLAGLLLSVLLVRAADVPTDAAGNFTGKVVETMNAASYTYVQVDTGSQKVWAATTHLVVTNGDNVTVFGGMPMANYHSKSLNRDFAVVYFTGKISINSGNAKSATVELPPGHPALPETASSALPPNHPPLPDSAASAKINLADIKKAPGGKTVQEIFKDSAKRSGQTVSVRGKVVKYNASIMGKNWLHIQDGSGSASQQNNDLLVTTATDAKVGDTVLVSGKIAVNQDFGAGYKYAVMLADAQVTVE